MLVDILVSLNTGFFFQGFIVLDHSKIFFNYIQHYLKGDILSLIPLLISNVYIGDFNNYLAFVTLIFFIKIKNFQSQFKKFEESFYLNPSTSSLISLSKLLFLVIFVAHLSSSVWLFSAHHSYYPQTWLTFRKL